MNKLVPMLSLWLAACGGESGGGPDAASPDASAPAVDAAPCVPQPWATELILDGAEPSGIADLHVGADGTVYVAFDNDHQAWFAERPPGGGWSADAIDVSVSRSSAPPAMALAPDGTPHVVYAQNTRNELTEIEHHWRADGTWNEELIDELLRVSTDDISYEIDADGRHHATYFGSSDMRYATMPAGGSWTAAAIGDDSTNDLAPIAVDDGGVVHLAFEDASADYALGYGKLAPGGDWVFEIADATTHYVQAADVAVTDGGGVLIAYSHYTDEQVKLAERTASGWAIEVAGDEPGWETQIAIDGEGTVHVVYYAATTSRDIVHASRAPGRTDWTTATVDTATPWTLAVDASGAGTVHAAYYVHQTNELRYAVRECL